MGEEGEEDEVDLGTGTNKSSKNVRKLGAICRLTATLLREEELGYIVRVRRDLRM